MLSHSRRNDAQPALWVIGLALLVVLAAVGGWQYRVLAARAESSSGRSTVVVQAVPAAPAEVFSSGAVAGTPVLPAAPPVRIVEGDEAVAFYFAEGQVEMPADAAKALGLIVRGVATGQTAVIQAYERSGGDPLQTAQRVLSIHNLLVSLGIGEDKIRRVEPELIPDWTQAFETDRVEVVLDAG